MKELVNQLRWQFVLLAKNKLVAISVAVTLVYGVIFYMIKDLENTEKFLTLLIYNDPAIIGMFFVGLSIIMEKNDSVFPALFVTPMSHHTYLISRILALSILGTLCAVGMTIPMLGWQVNWFQFCVGAFTTCIIFSLGGLLVVSYTSEFLNFMLRSIPLLIVLSLPLFNYFEITHSFLFRLTPIQGPLNLISSSFTNTHISSIWSYVGIIVWIPLLYLGIYRIFKVRMLKHIL